MRRTRLHVRRRVLAELDDMHRLCAVAGWSYVARAEGAAMLALHLGAITPDEYRAYWNRVQYCPGHEPGQLWCGYCKDVRAVEP